MDLDLDPDPGGPKTWIRKIRIRIQISNTDFNKKPAILEIGQILVGKKDFIFDNQIIHCKTKYFLILCE